MTFKFELRNFWDITHLNVTQIFWEEQVDYINLIEDRIKGWDFVTKVMNFRDS
jgi:hypothetical protein